VTGKAKCIKTLIHGAWAWHKGCCSKSRKEWKIVPKSAYLEYKRAVCQLTVWSFSIGPGLGGSAGVGAIRFYGVKDSSQFNANGSTGFSYAVSDPTTGITLSGGAESGVSDDAGATGAGGGLGVGLKFFIGWSGGAIENKGCYYKYEAPDKSRRPNLEEGECCELRFAPWND
jgi:hypothetical protein